MYEANRICIRYGAAAFWLLPVIAEDCPPHSAVFLKKPENPFTVMHSGFTILRKTGKPANGGWNGLR